MKKPAYRVTPGLLSKLSGIPRATIVNWLESRVTRPRRVNDLLKVVDALRLSEQEAEVLLLAAGLAVAPKPEQFWNTALPSPPTRLIGRETEVEQISAALSEPQARFVTLVGAGGVGKTHIALSVAGSVAGRFAGAVTWVPYAGIDDPAEILPAIASAIGAKETKAAPALRAIINVLSGKRVLLVLDNLEQLVDGTASIAELIESLPLLVVLATSRVPLSIRGERVFKISPLSASPAIDLFCARAAAAGSDLSAISDLAIVAEICRRLEGLPLAIELAAARTRVLAPPDLLDRLSHRLTLLTNGTRDSALRHRSLRDTIAWSYGLLTESQRAVLRRMSVFSGGASLDAAAFVCALGEYDASDHETLDLFTALVDHHLLNVTTANGQPLRLTMLETIREFAIEMLDQHDEEKRVRRLHAEYFLQLAESVDTVFASEPTVVWLSRLRTDHENLRVALAWAFEEAGDHEIGIQLAAALGRYWFERGLFREARRWLECARCCDHAPSATLSARIALYTAFVANYEGDYDSGTVAAQEALEAYTSIGDISGSTYARNALGIAALYTGDADLAEEHFTQALVVQRAEGDRRALGVALHNLGEVAAECRLDAARAERLYEESLALFESIGHTLNVASTLGALGELHDNLGNFELAITFATQAIDAYITVDNQPLAAECYTRLARYMLANGDDAEVAALLGKGAEQMRLSFNPRHVADCFEVHALLAYHWAKFESAAVFLGYSTRVRVLYHVPLLPASQRRHAAIVQKVRRQLSNDEFERFLEEGGVFSSDEAFGASRQFLGGDAAKLRGGASGHA